MIDFDIGKIREAIVEDSKFINDIQNSIQQVIVGQNDLIEKLLLAILADGHAGEAKPEMMKLEPMTVNINSASSEDLAVHLKGIGLKTAQAIIDYRNENGDFIHSVSNNTDTVNISFPEIIQNSPIINCLK